MEGTQSGRLEERQRAEHVHVDAVGVKVVHVEVTGGLEELDVTSEGLDPPRRDLA